MSQFEVVTTWDTGTSFILGDDRMTEVVEIVEGSGILPYNMSRSDLKEAFAGLQSVTRNAYGDQVPYRIGEQTGHYAHLYLDNLGRLHIGCQMFVGDEIDKIHKWAEGASMTKDEYEKRFNENQKIEGFGLQTTMHMPCPFCAAPDFIVYRIMEVQEALAKGGDCKECGRGMKAVFTKGFGGVSFEMMQTTGDPAPDYIPPMRRVE